MRFKPIVPKRPVLPLVRLKVGAALRDIGVRALDRLTDYPPQRAGARYRRTGELGRRWTLKGPEMRGQAMLVEVGTNLAYAPFVEGFRTKAPKQTKVARRAGWPSVEEVAKQEWKRGRRRMLAALQGK